VPEWKISPICSKLILVASPLQLTLLTLPLQDSCNSFMLSGRTNSASPTHIIATEIILSGLMPFLLIGHIRKVPVDILAEMY
jgi:hypothetical protein